MFGLKIFVRVQTFRRVPPVLPCNFCHPALDIYLKSTYFDCFVISRTKWIYLVFSCPRNPLIPGTETLWSPSSSQVQQCRRNQVRQNHFWGQNLEFELPGISTCLPWRKWKETDSLLCVWCTLYSRVCASSVGFIFIAHWINLNKSVSAESFLEENTQIVFHLHRHLMANIGIPVEKE